MYDKFARECPTGTIPYTVQRNDTIYTIAEKFNTNAQYLAYINGIDDLRVREGDIICVPKISSVPNCPNGEYYTITYGDTIFKIARKFDVTVQELLLANPYLNPYMLMVGQIICIPKKQKKCPKDSKPYRVKERDTYITIATRFDVSYRDMKKANKDVNWNRIKPGDEICIPPSRPSKDCKNRETYIIQRGENLSLIAEKFLVSAQDLLRVNPEMIPSEFVAGRLICIPRKQVQV